MDVLKASSMAPISVLCENRLTPRKPFSLLPTASFHKCSSSSSHLSRNLQRSLVLASSFLGTAGLAQALDYDGALQQSVVATSVEFDASGVLDSIVSFGTDNPLAVGGGIVALAVPFILSNLLTKPKAYGIQSARSAYGALGDDASAQLLDIRNSVEIRKAGSPDIRGLGKKAVAIVYDGKNNSNFLKKLFLKLKDPQKTTLFILDKFDGNSELVAELLAANGVKAAYAIKDGTEGPRGWMNSSLPWIPPKKTLDLSSISESLGGAFQDGDDVTAAGIIIAAAAGFGLLAYSEVELILQILGVVAFLQFSTSNLLFAEDRKKFLKQVDEFVDTKVAPQRFLDDIKQIGVALLPVQEAVPALPPPSSEAAAEQVSEPPPSHNNQKPQSPYPAYTDFKPPTSPTPSQP